VPHLIVMVGRILIAMGVMLSVMSVALVSGAHVSRAEARPESLASLAYRAAWAVACLPYSGEQRVLPRASIGVFTCG